MNLAEKKKFIINFLYFSVFFAVLYVVFKVLFVYLLPFVIGFIIAYAVQKPAAFVSKKIKIKQQICAAVLSVFVYAAFISLVILIIWILYNQLESVLKNFSQIEYFFEDVYSAAKNIFKNSNEKYEMFFKKLSNDTVNNLSEKLSLFLTNSVTVLIKKIPQLLVSGIITVVATCYIAKDFEKLKKFTKGFISEKIFAKTAEIVKIFKECFLKFILGYFWLFVLTFTELIVGFFILGINHIFLIALLVSFVDILPILGAGTVLMPWSVINFIKGDFFNGMGILLLYAVITVIRNFAEPKIIGKQIDINPIFTLIFFFLGLRLGGFFGMLIFPIALTVAFTYYRRKFSTDKVI